MAGCRIPGTLRDGGFSIDEGTLCLTTSMPPGSVGSLPIALDRQEVQEVGREYFRVVIRDALRRGARDLELSMLVTKYSIWLNRQVTSASSVQSPTLQLAVGSADDWAHLVVDQEKAAWSAVIDEEMARISTLVGSGKPIKDKDDYRHRVRPLYYGAGYVEPAEFLEGVVLYTILGKFDVWIHEDLATRLEKLRPALERWSTGLAAATAKEVGSMMGIQIRTIAGSSTLSNHAFGLAIDVDAYSNPHVVKQEVIDALNWVVYRKGIPFDFGRDVVSQSERGHQGYTADDALEIYNRTLPASEAIRAWLQQHLPRYRQVTAQIEAAEKELGIRKTKSTASLQGRASAAVTAMNRGLRERELKSKKTATASPDDSRETAATNRVHEALSTIAADEHLSRIQVLYENIDDTKYIDTWEKRGVLTVPMYLVAAMVGELKLRWGEQYERSKDAMHFELIGKAGKPYFSPDFPLAAKEKPRTLDRILDEAFIRSAQLWKLTPPPFLQTRRKKR